MASPKVTDPGLSTETSQGWWEDREPDGLSFWEVVYQGSRTKCATMDEISDEMRGGVIHASWTI